MTMTRVVIIYGKVLTILLVNEERDRAARCVGKTQTEIV